MGAEGITERSGDFFFFFPGVVKELLCPFVSALLSAKMNGFESQALSCLN